MQEGVPSIREKPLTGPANHVVCVIQELKKAGHQVSLLAKIDNQIYYSEDLEDFQPVGIHWMDQGPLKLLEKAIRRIQSGLHLAYANYFVSMRFAQACQQVLPDCDIYFERMGWLAYGGGMAAQKLKIPLILEVNGDHLDEFRSLGLSVHKSQEYISCFLMKLATSRASHVIATGEGWRRKYIERWKVDPSSVSVVENGSLMIDLLRREDLKSFQPISSGIPLRIVYCGGFEPWHGIQVLIRAVKKVIDLGQNLQITLVGFGSEEQKINKLISELDLRSIITMAGRATAQELAMYLSKADIGVSPYCGRAEYSGLKLLDYKSAGLATIASGENHDPSVLKHLHTGWIVPPCDENALSQAILTLANNPQLRIKIGHTARFEAEAYHSWRHTVEHLLDIFAKVKKSKL